MTEERIHELEDLYYALKPSIQDWVTFDCYGTLIDWEAGILDYVRRLMMKKKVHRPVGTFLKVWEPIQFQMIQRPWQSYRDILYQSMYETFLQLGIPWRPSDSLGFGDAMGNWKPFPEVPSALRRIRRVAKIALITNTDDDIVKGTLEQLGVPVDLVVTAESVRSYKPSPKHFEVALERMKADPQECLHVSGFFDYDIAPAREVGFRTCFINRTGRPAPAKADLHVQDVTGVAEALGA